ncbi:hypothetical protein JQ604_39380 [Bradyrhizobium jicamae]|uniref:hypothetical protein n=1 Tax=Bradyrhizobium jicamae TaxID=280332 RepID=UPI001BA4E5FC|nr:hypothetical protein [Bradyrhizobium jicamae]MBR0758279.1 hypothetical protein [Bradyrhizobium jicamae]
MNVFDLSRNLVNEYARFSRSFTKIAADGLEPDGVMLLTAVVAEVEREERLRLLSWFLSGRSSSLASAPPPLVRAGACEGDEGRTPR